MNVKTTESQLREASHWFTAAELKSHPNPESVLCL